MPNVSPVIWEPLEQAPSRFNELIRALKNDDTLAPVTVVCPSTYAGLSLRHAMGRGGFANVRFQTLSGLAELLAGPLLALEGQRPLTPLVTSVAVRATARTAQGPLEPFAEHPALYRSLHRSFHDLAAVTPAALISLASHGGILEETVRLYQQFRSLTANHYDRERLMQAATAAITTGPTLATLRDFGVIVFYLVDRLSPTEHALVAALSGAAASYTIHGLTGDPETDAAFPDGPPPSPVPSSIPAATQLLLAPDPRQEVRWIVRDIARAMEQGTPLWRIAVLFRQPAPYAALVQQALEFADIPVAGASSVMLAQTAVGRTLRGLVTLADGKFARDDVITWLTECPLSLDDWLPEGSSPAVWDALSRQAGVVGGLRQWRSRLARVADEADRRAQDSDHEGETPAPVVTRLRQQAATARRFAAFMDDLGERTRLPQQQDDWRAWAEWASTLLRHYLVHPSRLPDSEFQALERIEQGLHEVGGLETLGTAAGASFAAFRLAVDEVLAVTTGRIGRFGDGVFLGTLAAAHGVEFDRIYIAGMNEGVTPLRAFEDPLLPDHIRQTAGGAAAGLPLSSGRQADERAAYVQALATAPQRFLSSPRSEGYPSRWFLEAASQLHGAPVYTSTLEHLNALPWLTVVASLEDGLRQTRQQAAADLHDYDLLAFWRWRAAHGSLEQHHLAAAPPIARALERQRQNAAPSLTEWDGDVSALAANSRRLRHPEEAVMSPTSLETWATCPYRYFLGQVLGLTALDRPEEILTLSALERGSLSHAILEQFLRAVRERGEMPVPTSSWSGDHRVLLQAIANAAFAETEARGVTGKRLLWELEQEALLSDLDEFLLADARLRARFGVVPHAFEQRFGLPGPDARPPAIWETPTGGRLQFRGVVDRVDVSPFGDRVLALDYKTGRTNSYSGMKDDPVDRGRRLQLPVYALAMQQALGTDTPVLAAYWFISAQGGFALIPPEPVELAALLEPFAAVVTVITGGIGAGLFPANPGKPGQYGYENCGYCPFDAACPSRRGLDWQRKQGDPRLLRYVQMAGGATAPDGSESAGAIAP